MDLNEDISTLQGVGETRAKKLNKIDINSVKDLLYHFPRTYQDLSQPTNISLLQESDDMQIVEAVVSSITIQKTARRRMTIAKAVLEDDSGSIIAVWFNQPFIKRALRDGEKYIFYGKLGYDYKTGALQLQSPKYEKYPKIIPVYSETEGLSSKQIRILLSGVLSEARSLKDPLPVNIIKRYKLMPLGDALWSIHNPSSQGQLSRARRRLAFDELFEVVTQFIRFERDLGRRQAPAISIDDKILKNFVSKLPFELTDSQRIAAWKIIKKMSGRKPVASSRKLEVNKNAGVGPLNALLNGDVGSGKTVVALLASICATNNNFNAVWMAPTSILAEQHYKTVKELTSGLDINIELVTAATDTRKKDCHFEVTRETPTRSLTSVRDDRISDHPHTNQHSSSIIIGTHALLHRKNAINDIGLLVIDEQHRFGVEQRRELLENDNRGLVPHFLSMTATPIPRSLAMLVSGMTMLITIKEKPKERKPIATKVFHENGREEVYKMLDRELTKGRQAFIITPLISSSNASSKTLFSEKKAVESEYDKLKKTIFKNRKIGLLHGKMKAAEKEKIMKQMLDREISILVSTSVVEVGVDIPNATVMLIENADSFGLAQLHQFRGRVGRSKHQSYCFLSIVDNANKKTEERLSILEKTNDGFIIAQKDLELRGPGSLSGLDQSGFFDMKLASLGDTELLEQAKEAAEEVYNVNNKLITDSE